MLQMLHTRLQPTPLYRSATATSKCKVTSTVLSSRHSSSMTVADQPLPGSLHTTKLQDGRLVSYSVCGSTQPGAHTVLFLHPIQGNRFMALVLHAAAQELNLRIVAPDRPGVGESSHKPQRTVVEYPADIAELCDQLGVNTFSIMASSAGTMYALACTLSEHTKHRVVGKPTIVAPWVPSSSRCSRGGSLLAALGAWVPVAVLNAFVGFQNNLIYKQSLNKPVTDLMTRSTPTEVAAFANDPHYDTNNTAYKHMIAQWGPSQAGIVHEMQLCMERASSQRLHYSYAQDVQAPVRVFAGTADSVQPFQHVKEWAEGAAHQNVELIAIEGGTHDGIMHTHKVKALRALAADLGR